MTGASSSFSMTQTEVSEQRNTLNCVDEMKMVLNIHFVFIMSWWQLKTLLGSFIENENETKDPD